MKLFLFILFLALIISGPFIYIWIHTFLMKRKVRNIKTSPRYVCVYRSLMYRVYRDDERMDYHLTKRIGLFFWRYNGWRYTSKQHAIEVIHQIHDESSTHNIFYSKIDLKSRKLK